MLKKQIIQLQIKDIKTISNKKMKNKQNIGQIIVLKFNQKKLNKMIILKLIMETKIKKFVQVVINIKNKIFKKITKKMNRIVLYLNKKINKVPLYLLNLLNNKISINKGK